MTKLELLRRYAGLSQRELARRIEVSSSLVTQVERLHRRPWPAFRLRVSEVLGVPEADLFGPDGWPLTVDVEHVLAVSSK